MLQWRDRLGQYHDLPNLNDTSCNIKDPVWLTNFGKIMDKNLLPVTSVRFGPHKYETQKAKITIRTLQCQQEEEVQFDTKKEIKELQGRVLKLEVSDKFDNQTEIQQEDRLNKLEDESTKKFANLEKFHTCPLEKENVKVLIGKCYLFEKQTKTFQDAKENCENVFSSNLRGHLFEPQSKYEHNLVCDEAVQVFGGHHWFHIGIQQSANFQNVEYVSNGVQSSLQLWAKGGKGSGRGIVTNGQSRNPYKWSTYSSSGTFRSVCQLL